MNDTTTWTRLKQFFGVDFHAQAIAEVRREEDSAARRVVTKLSLDGGNR